MSASISQKNGRWLLRIDLEGTPFRIDRAPIPAQQLTRKKFDPARELAELAKAPTWMAA